MSLNNDPNYIAKLIEEARKEVHDFWSDINHQELNRLLKQLHEIESQKETNPL